MPRNNIIVWLSLFSSGKKSQKSPETKAQLLCSYVASLAMHIAFLRPGFNCIQAVLADQLKQSLFLSNDGAGLCDWPCSSIGT